MLEPLEKEANRVMPARGLLWQLRQSTDEQAGLELVEFDTKEMQAHKVKGRAIFVLNPQGEIFAGSHEMNKFHR